MYWIELDSTGVANEVACDCKCDLSVLIFHKIGKRSFHSQVAIVVAIKRKRVCCKELCFLSAAVQGKHLDRCMIKRCTSVKTRKQNADRSHDKASIDTNLTSAVRGQHPLNILTLGCGKRECTETFITNDFNEIIHLKLKI